MKTENCTVITKKSLLYDKTLHQYDTGNCKFFHTVNPYLEKKMKYFF